MNQKKDTHYQSGTSNSTQFKEQEYVNYLITNTTLPSYLFKPSAYSKSWEKGWYARFPLFLPPYESIDRGVKLIRAFSFST